MPTQFKRCLLGFRLHLVSSPHGSAHNRCRTVRPRPDAEDALIKRVVVVAVQEETRRKFGVEQNGWCKTSYTGRFFFAGCKGPDLAKIRAEKDSLEERAKQLVA